MSLADDIRGRMKHTAARIKHLTRVKAALTQLQKKRAGRLAKLTPKPKSNKLDVFGIDYAWGRPTFAAMEAEGVHFVMRYISHDASKDLSRVELASLRSHGVRVGVVFETTANRALGGFDAGVEDARFAKARCHSLGLHDIPVYFGVDFDATPSQRKAVTRYLNGAVSVLGYDRVGVYGSFYVCKDAQNLKTCRWLWQTLAWSGGQVLSGVHIYQYSNGHKLVGVSCDFNHASYAGVAGSMR